ncbi:hypothetical protein BGW38_000982 [Lunasporangiospora selenospora]|uniref:Chitin-binding type-4 domain-containing protein n=1 Tax=Lunasporangiospora selenospora TaxID=979761 RepID=A0A9P6G321_9FUNG|nr:hypothetical protein BGW38_000982 [Lunasporangiospora selenospora]
MSLIIRAFIDFDCRDAPLYDGCGGGVGKTYPCGGYPPDKQIIQTFHAGEVINVRFGNAQYGAPGQQDLTPSSNQARHSGGLCEFSVSYDQGKTFGVVGRYHHSCPDIFYDWPVKLPANLPSCENCIFAWSWINAFTTAPEFYMGCADIQIIGRQESVVAVAAANLTPIRIANIPGYPYYHAPGDQFGNTKSDGPNVAEIDTNMASAAGEQDVSFQPMYSLRKRDRLAFRQRFPPPNR